MGRDDLVADEERLWRRVHHSQFFDGRITSAAFTDPEMSVDRAEVVESEMSGDHHRIMGDARCVAEVTAGFFRTEEIGQSVEADPLEENPAHALVIGKKSKGVCRKIARAARLLE